MQTAYQITTRQRSCEGNVFTGVCLSVHGGEADALVLTTSGDTEAGGTHPTRMHSCFLLNLNTVHSQYLIRILKNKHGIRVAIIPSQNGTSAISAKRFQNKTSVGILSQT